MIKIGEAFRVHQIRTVPGIKSFTVGTVGPRQVVQVVQVVRIGTTKVTVGGQLCKSVVSTSKSVVAARRNYLGQLCNRSAHQVGAAKSLHLLVAFIQ